MKKVAIIGLGQNSDLIPDDFYTWGLPWGKDYTLDKYFEMHSNWRDASERYGEGAEDFLSDFENISFVGEKATENATEYPLETVVNVFGPYLSCSIAYMLANAILEGFNVINLYGVSGDDGYQSQRPNLEYLIGFGRGRGIEINVSSESKLLKNEFKEGLYGYGDK